MTTPIVAPAVRDQTTCTVLIVDAMEGVRAAIRWLLRGHDDLAVVAEAAGVADARALGVRADVVVSGVTLTDGVAADLARDGRTVVVHTWLPEDEWPPGSTHGCTAVVRHGSLASLLAPAVRAAAQSFGRDPERDIDVAGSDRGSR